MFDIAIVGGGITGLALAQSLAQDDFSVLILEANPLLFEVNFSHQTRVVALSSSSVNLLHNIGVWRNIAAYAGACTAMSIWDSDGFATLNFGEVQRNDIPLAYIVPNNIIVAELLASLKQAPSVTILPNCSVNQITQEDNGVMLTTTLGNFRAGMLVGADGANSSVRELLEIPLKVTDYQQVAIVATLESEQPHQGKAWQKFSSDGTLALLPLCSPYQSSMVWSVLHPVAQQLLALDDVSLGERLTKEMAVLGKIKIVDSILTFNLRRQHAKVYTKSRCVLVGDAAHVIHPLAGWGVNLGLMDVARLSEILLNAKKLKRDYASSRMLLRYERACVANNWVMLELTDMIQKIFISRNKTLMLGRNLAMNAFNHSFIQSIALKIASGDGFNAPALLRRFSYDN